MQGSGYRWSHHRAPGGQSGSIAYFAALHEVGHDIDREAGRWQREHGLSHTQADRLQQALYRYTESMFRLGETLGCHGTVSDEAYREAAREQWPAALRFFHGGPLCYEGKNLIRAIDGKALAYHHSLHSPQSRVSEGSVLGRAKQRFSSLFDPNLLPH